MEKLLKKKIVELEKALKNFQSSLEIEKKDLSDEIVDTINSGQIQKFEFCIEILWKIIKLFISINDGIDVNSPKKAIKEFFNIGYIDYEKYELLLQMIDDRNYLSHIYKQELFAEILEKLPVYLNVMLYVFSLLKEEE
jgi:nucleotidyltransferase substrate binding protein (TIGR01987 family)